MATSNAGVARRRNVDGVVLSAVCGIFVALSLAGCEERSVHPASSLAALSGERAGACAADGGMHDGALAFEDAMADDARQHDAMSDATDAMVQESDATGHELDATVHDHDAMAHEHDAMAEPDDDAGTEPDASTPPDPPDSADEHCAMVMPPDPRDESLESSEPVVWQSNRARDVLLPQAVIDWMDEQELQQAHNAWHTTRRWDDVCGESFARAEECDFAQSLIAEGLWRAEIQQGAPGAGAAFLHMHRHMIQMFKAAFPKHADLFSGWSHVPRSRLDPENPTPWRSITWTSDNLAGFDILENIEDHIDEFPNDDELGVFIESTFRWTPEAPFVGEDRLGSGTHGAMHGQWAVSRSPANLARTDTALPNFVFWKLHGFIDDVWSRYRIAKGSSDDDPSYRAVAHEECRLMYFLAPANRPEPPPLTDAPLKRH